MAAGRATITPLFCVKTTDTISNRKLIINFRANSDFQAPEVDITEDKIAREILNPSPEIEGCKIPFRSSPIFWSKHVDGSGNNDRYYVTYIEINDKFAFRKVLSSEIIRHFLITVAIDAIEDKYNSNEARKVTKQSIGHQLSLDQGRYEIITSKLQVEHSEELVNNKVVVIPDPMPMDGSIVGTLNDCEAGNISYDLHFRPKLMLTTCSFNIDRVPDKISFNDDRLTISLGNETIIDIHLPLFIDLKEPVKYKFDDRLSLFRMVFKMIELPPPPKGV